MINNEKGSLRKERKNIQLSIRLCEKDFMELKRISPKNVSYAIQRMIRINYEDGYTFRNKSNEDCFYDG